MLMGTALEAGDKIPPRVSAHDTDFVAWRPQWRLLQFWGGVDFGGDVTPDVGSAGRARAREDRPVCAP